MRKLKLDTPLKGAKLVRSMLLEIESSLDDGYSLNDVWESLDRDLNLKLTFQSFKKLCIGNKQKLNHQAPFQIKILSEVKEDDMIKNLN